MLPKFVPTTDHSMRRSFMLFVESVVLHVLICDMYILREIVMDTWIHLYWYVFKILIYNIYIYICIILHFCLYIFQSIWYISMISIRWWYFLPFFNIHFPIRSGEAISWKSVVNPCIWPVWLVATRCSFSHGYPPGNFSTSGPALLSRWFSFSQGGIC